VTAVGLILGRNVIVHDEVMLTELSACPDIAVNTAGGRLGYIELKRHGKGVPEHESWRPSQHDRLQWPKLRDLPNLIYTDGTHWALYKKGLLFGRVSCLEGDPATAGDKLTTRDDSFERLFYEFFAWIPPNLISLRAVVSEVAPLCRLLRNQVAEMMALENNRPGKKPFTILAHEWRNILFPNLKDDQFADAYAQAVTFALMLARVDGVSFESRSLTEIAAQLGKKHPLLGEALSILTHSKWVSYLSVVETLRRIVGNINWDNVNLSESGVYTLLYETFLAEYDPQLRRESGTYYTPDLVARAMVRMTDEVLKARLSKARGLAADDVIVVDPAMGTGTFLVEVIESVVKTLTAERRSAAVPAAHLRELFAKRLVGFELQAAPFAVAELRLHHILKNQYGVDLPQEEVRFFCNTLDDPDTLSIDFGQLYDILQAAREGANAIKRDRPVMVVIGNPPWRERAAGEAPWLEARRNQRFGPPDLRARPSLDEFRLDSQWKRAFNLKNMWTYFWRWAAWKVFDAHPDDPAGVVTLITPRSYLSSESHAGMRRYLRQTTDEGWIIDLSPEGFEPPVQTRIFPRVRQPICIAIFARCGPPTPTTAARVRYTSLSGSQQQKFSQLTALSLEGREWEECDNGWEDPFQPSDPIWNSYPKLDDLFPRQTTGVNANRNWVWAPDRETLRLRWSELIHATPKDKRELFKETDYRSIHRQVPAVPGIPSGLRPIAEETNDEPTITRAAFHSFDRQFLVLDHRVIDRPREELWLSQGSDQVYMSEPPGYLLSGGPAITFAALVPYVHHFMAHDGGRVIPLYLDPAGHRPNMAPGLPQMISELIKSTVTEKDLLAYVAAIVAHPAYTVTFQHKLIVPGIRVPITAEASLWREAIEIGREVLWLHTYGERYVDPESGRPKMSPRVAAQDGPRYIQPIPADEDNMPNNVYYEVSAKSIIVELEKSDGSQGRIEGVEPAVWNYKIGDRRVIDKWFSYRLREPRRKKRTSKLDSVNPTRWTAQFDDELLDLLHVLHRCVELESRQAELLDRVRAGIQVTVSDLHRAEVFPVPDATRKPPQRVTQPQLPLTA
jgi:hypothetical protein